MVSTTSSEPRKQEAEDRKKSKMEQDTTAASEDETAIAEDDTSKIPEGYDVFAEEALAPLMSDNRYAQRRTAAESILDASLLVANFTQLRTLTTLEGTKNWAPALAMVLCSLALQLTFVFVVIAIWIRGIEKEHKKEYMLMLHELAEARKSLDSATMMAARDKLIKHMSHRKYGVTLCLDNFTLVLAALICVCNIVILTLGIEF
ncbi:unnamed protein product [Candidula unifasciata]|uniref:Ninjurin-1 n=1 Tax=Candidula unifasciata TaxID=100452 RepID=A0A8S3YNB8_9EUPU|nr:unnamed protein product [Candidula unifasciata]